MPPFAPPDSDLIAKFLRKFGVPLMRRFDYHELLRHALIHQGFEVRSIERCFDSAPLWEIRLVRGKPQHFDSEKDVANRIKTILKRLGQPLDRDSVHAYFSRVTVIVTLLWPVGKPGLLKVMTVDGKETWCYSLDWQSPLKLIRNGPTTLLQQR